MIQPDPGGSQHQCWGCLTESGIPDQWDLVLWSWLSPETQVFPFWSCLLLSGMQLSSNVLFLLIPQPAAEEHEWHGLLCQIPLVNFHPLNYCFSNLLVWFLVPQHVVNELKIIHRGICCKCGHHPHWCVEQHQEDVESFQLCNNVHHTQADHKISAFSWNTSSWSTIWPSEWPLVDSSESHREVCLQAQSLWAQTFPWSQLSVASWMWGCHEVSYSPSSFPWVSCFWSSGF